MKNVEVVIGDEVRVLTFHAAFELAERICSVAYAAQGGPSSDPDVRDGQQQARVKREATSFEELYCAIRDVADDWHREAVRRKAGSEVGKYNAGFCHLPTAIERTFRVAFERVKDWDY